MNEYGENFCSSYKERRHPILAGATGEIFFFQLVCYCYSFQKLTMDVIKIKQIVVGFITDTKMLWIEVFEHSTTRQVNEKGEMFLSVAW